MKQLGLTLGLCAVAPATPSLAEWKAIGRREQGFTMVDADKNGKVTPEKLRAAAVKMRR